MQQQQQQARIRTVAKVKKTALGDCAGLMSSPSLLALPSMRRHSTRAHAVRPSLSAACASPMGRIRRNPDLYTNQPANMKTAQQCNV